MSKEKKSDLTASNEQYVEVNSPFRVNSIHSKGNDRGKVRQVFYDIVTNVMFNFGIYFLILGNTVTLALYRYDQSDL